MNRTSQRRLATRFSMPAMLLLACVASSTAFAHPGHGAEGGFIVGFGHPFEGIDHLLVMLAVGLWSAMLARRAWPDLLYAPLAFVGLLFASVLWGMAGGHLPLAESAIALSVVVVGLLIALRVYMPGAAAAIVVGAFAIFHGVVHGQSFAGSADAWPAVAGLLVATSVLHVIGIAFGWALRTRTVPGWSRLAGGAIVATGMVILFGIA